MTASILLADDDQGYLFPIANMFEDAGYKVYQVKDKNGVKLRAKEADIWIIDARLPSGSYEGIQVVKELAKDNITSHYKVIFISVIDQDFPKEHLQDLTVPYEWVEKPFELEYLLKMVVDITKGKKQ